MKNRPKIRVLFKCVITVFCKKFLWQTCDLYDLVLKLIRGMQNVIQFIFIKHEQKFMYYSERLNTISHLAGAILSFFGLIVLVVLASLEGDPWKIVSFSIYGATLLILYAVSTYYHWVKNKQLKDILRKMDHISIYLLIAGSYTPFALVTLRGGWGWTLFGISWGLAFFGIAQEFILGKTTRRLSLIIYIVMGWLIVIALYPLLQNFSNSGLFWLVTGGVLYSSGIYFFINDEKIKHGHGIWHLFVLGGSFCQFLSICFYV